MKLVIYDSNWPFYRPLLERCLRTSWSISSGAADLAWLLRELPDADAMIGLTLPAAARFTARRLRLFHFPGAGVLQSGADEYPSECELCNVYEHEIPIGEYVLMVVLMHATGVLRFSARFREGYWDGTGRACGELHQEIYGKRLGLVGLGRIGQAIALRAQPLGLQVEAIRKNPRAPLPPEIEATLSAVGGPEDLCGLLARSDFVVITCPLNEETRAWIGTQELAHMPPHSLLVNVARAEIIQEEPLYRALERNQISAALDVWYRYPDTVDKPFHGSRFPFHQLPNVIATPHLSAWTSRMVERRMLRIAENLDRLYRNQPRERVVLTGTWKPLSPGRDSSGNRNY